VGSELNQDDYEWATRYDHAVPDVDDLHQIIDALRAEVAALKEERGRLARQYENSQRTVAEVTRAFEAAEALVGRLRPALARLVNAAVPFTSGDIVDETSGTIPLMNELDEALLRARAALAEDT
jgi:hypothetical protein